MAPSTVFASCLVLAALAASANGLLVNTPSGLVTCQPSALTWSSGTAPYYLSILPGGQPSAAALESFPATSDMSYTWTVNLAAGTSITLQIKDSTGTLAYSDQATIQAGADTSCVGSSASGAAAAGTSTTTTSAVGMTTTTRAAATTTSAAGGVVASVTSAVSGATSSAAAAAASVTGSASRTAAVGAAGALVLAAAVVLA